MSESQKNVLLTTFDSGYEMYQSKSEYISGMGFGIMIGVMAAFQYDDYEIHRIMMNVLEVAREAKYA